MLVRLKLPKDLAESVIPLPKELDVGQSAAAGRGVVDEFMPAVINIVRVRRRSRPSRL